MIFFDETGKRWKRIKRSTAGMAVLAATPLVALVAASLVYTPQWTSLPVVRQVSGAVQNAFTNKPQVAAAQTNPAGSPTAKPSPTKTPVKTSTRVALAGGTVLSASSVAGAATPAPTATPAATPSTARAATPSPTPNPSGRVPGRK